MARRDSGRSRTARVLAGGAVAATVAAGIGLSAGAASAATGPTWSRTGPTARGGEITAVTSVQWGSGNTSKWAFNSTASQTDNKGYPSVWSQTNTADWAYQTLPGSEPGETFVAATAISNKDVLAFTSVPNGTGREWQFTGSTWKVIKTFDAPVGGADATSATDVWVFGSANAASQLGVYHYNGTTWAKVASTLHGGDGLSAGNAWAYSGTTVAHWNGKAWAGTNLASLIQGSAPRLADVYETDGTTYAVGVTGNQGNSVVLIYNGHTWARAGEAAGYVWSANQISGDGDGGIWFPVSKGPADTSSDVVHYTRSVKTLTETSLPGLITSITRVDQTDELAGGEVLSGKSSPVADLELEYYN